MAEQTISQEIDRNEAIIYRELKSPERIDKLAASLATIGVRVPGRDTAFFQAVVRQWLSGTLK